MKKLTQAISILLLSAWVFYAPALAYEKEIQGISNDIAGKIAASGKTKIAVVDFTDLQGNTTELGRFIAEELSVDLTIDAQNFEVVDRTNLKSILKEHKLTLSGLISPETVKEIGQLSGVDALVTGTVTPFGDNIRVTCKVIATYSAKVISAAKADIAKTKAIEELLARGIDTETQTTTMNTQKPQTSTYSPSSKSSMREEAEGFVFDLQECKFSSGKVTCTLLITNTDDSTKIRKFYIDSARIIDGQGNEYSPEDVKIGNSGNSQDLPVGIPVKTVLKFDAETSPSFIAVLELRGSGEGYDYTMQMQNIAVRTAK